MMVQQTHPVDDQPVQGRLNLLLSRAGWQTNPWVDRLPTLLAPLGIHSLIAETANTAKQVIRSNPIHIAVVDLALPLDDTPGAEEESGIRILELLSRQPNHPPTVVIKRNRTVRDNQREMNAALRAGAFAVVDRPHAQDELESLLQVLRRCLDRHYQSRWPGTA